MSQAFKAPDLALPPAGPVASLFQGWGSSSGPVVSHSIHPPSSSIKNLLNLKSDHTSALLYKPSRVPWLEPMRQRPNLWPGNCVVLVPFGTHLLQTQTLVATCAFISPARLSVGNTLPFLVHSPLKKHLLQGAFLDNPGRDGVFSVSPEAPSVFPSAETFQGQKPKPSESPAYRKAPCKCMANE